MSDENNHEEVHSDRWPEMSLTELYEQLSILQTRALTAAELNNTPMLQQIQTGIDLCTGIIATKSTDGNHTVLT